jgi:glycerophosphoryl diester phosphodiesterase
MWRVTAESLLKIEAHRLVAHRGYQQHYPENTLLAIRKAIEAGALHVEFDVQLSRDQVPVIYHDDTLDRMSGRAGRVCELKAGELQTVSAHEPGRFKQRFVEEKIATLAELTVVIEQSPAVTFYVELKEEAVRDHGAEICLQQIRQVLNPVLSQCVLISFDAKALAKAADAGFSRIGLVTRDWARREEQISALGMSVLFVNKTRIPAGEPATASCPVVVYEVGTQTEALLWLQRGADKVESFAVGELLGSTHR